MLRQAALSLTVVAASAVPALADVVTCEASDRETSIEIAVDFSETRDAGIVEGVRVVTPDYRLSTYRGELDRPEETLAFSEVAFDRIELGLESQDAGPMTLLVKLVRAAIFDPEGGPDRDVVVAGVARIGFGRTVTLTCIGW